MPRLGAAVDVCCDAPVWGNGLNARRMAVLQTFRARSLCRHVHRELLRGTVRDWTPIIAATVCHRRNGVETYSRSIERLKEYCAPLISAAVTGKIDVRREVA